MPRVKEEERSYIPRQIRLSVLKECGHKCAHCGAPLFFSTNMTMEHVIPLHKGGSNEADNLVVLCEACNKDKNNDVIEPALYYPHLPKPKLKQVQATFQKYVANVRWLDYQTVFMTDRFMLSYLKTLPFNKNTRHVTSVTAQCFIRKMQIASTLEPLMLYAARLSTYDKPIIPVREQDIAAPYHGIYINDTLMALINVRIEETDSPTPLTENDFGTVRPVIYLDFLPMPDPHFKPNTCLNYANLLSSLLKEMRRPLQTLDQDAGIEVIVRTPRSDELGKAALSLLYQQYPSKYILFQQYFGDDDTGAVTCCANALLKKNSLENINYDQADKNELKPGANDNMKNLNSSVKQELDKSEKPAAPIAKLKKGEKKGLHRKKNRKRNKN